MSARSDSMALADIHLDHQQQTSWQEASHLFVHQHSWSDMEMLTHRAVPYAYLSDAHERALIGPVGFHLLMWAAFATIFFGDLSTKQFEYLHGASRSSQRQSSTSSDFAMSCERTQSWVSRRVSQMHGSKKLAKWRRHACYSRS
jgi:hypothetical protein